VPLGAVKVLLYIRACILSDLNRKLLSDSGFSENRRRKCSSIPLTSTKFNLHVLRDVWYVGSKERLIKFVAHRFQSYTFREINIHSANGAYSCRIFDPMSVFKRSLTFRFEVLTAVTLTMKTAVSLNVKPCSMVGVCRRFGTPAAWIINVDNYVLYLRLVEGERGKIGKLRTRWKDDSKMNVKEMRWVYGLHSSG
jgi:hypothetical protein